MTVEDLTPEQVADLEADDLRFRGLLTTLLAAFRTADPQQWVPWYSAEVAPVLAQLGPDEVLPTRTALAGAKPLTAAERLLASELLGKLIELRNDPKYLPLLVKAVGINAG